ncbi:MAG: serine/threonine-protein kinase [Acidobacteriota bacterium]
MTASILGTSIRNIRVQELLGEGGMGDVYVGYDEKLGRRVALKALRREHRLRPEAKARLLREARILSQLDHPNICRIYDFVETGETDYLVLELIRGSSLRDVMQDDLEPRDAMQIAIQVADVLVAAHGSGVIHRDLKPENVMIAAGNQVKVLDFGIARSVNEDLSEDDDEIEPGRAREQQDRSPPRPIEGQYDDPEATTAVFSGSARAEGTGGRGETLAGFSDQHQETVAYVHTELGSIMGTIAYMSPEQARGEVVTSASDMYSFGLLLQEILTGESPYEKLSAGILLTKVAKAETLPASGLDGDLSTLIERLKSLEPGARPAAADTLERLRWIRNKPRARRRRQLRAVALAASVLVALIMSMLAFSTARARDMADREALRANQEATRANQEALRANQEAETARQVTDFLVDIFEESDPNQSRGAQITAREVLDRGAARVDELSDQPLVQGTILHSISTVYRNLGLYDDGIALAERARDVLRAELEANHPDILRIESQLGTLYRNANRFEDAEAVYSAVLDTCRERCAPDDDLFVRLCQAYGTLLVQQGRLQEAQAILEDGLAWLARQPEQPTDDERRAQAAVYEINLLHPLAFSYYSESRLDEARALHERCITLRRTAQGSDHPDLAWSLQGLALVLIQQDELEAAEPLLDEGLAIRKAVLGDDHPLVGWMLGSQLDLYVQQGRYDAAASIIEQLERFTLDPSNQAVLEANRGAIDDAMGARARANRRYDAAIASIEGAFGDEHSELAAILIRRGNHHLQWSDANAALADFRRAQGLLPAGDARPSLSGARVLIGIASAYRLQGKPSQARSLYDGALNQLQTLTDDRHSLIGMTHLGLARLALDDGRAGDAKRHALEARDHFETRLGAAHPRLAEALITLAAAHRLAGDAARADALEERARSIVRRQLGPSNPTRRAVERAQA